jgi:O-antigen/teichoic acid export membrane protein
VVHSICQWGFLSVLAKLTAVEVVGEYTLAVAVTAPLLYVANFNVGVMLVTDTKRQFSFADYRTARLLLIAISLLAALGICLASTFSSEVFILTVIVAIAQSADSMSELYRSVMLRSEQMSRIAGSLMLRGCISVAVAAAVLVYSKSIIYTVAAMALVRFGVLFAYDIPLGRDRATAGGGWQGQRSEPGEEPRNARQFRGSRLRAVLKITGGALPLTIVSLLVSLVLNMPRYFIEKYVGPRQLGIFAAMWSLLTAGNMIAMALGQSIFPRLSKLYAGGDVAAFKQIIFRAVQIGLILGVLGVTGAIVAGRQILTLAYRAEYAQERWMFVAVMGIGTLAYIITLLGNAATSARAFKPQAVLMTVVVLATFVSCLAMVPTLGVWGAIWSVGIGLLTQIAGLVFIVFRLVKRQSERLVLAAERV